MNVLQKSDIKLVEYPTNGGSGYHSAVFANRLREILEEFGHSHKPPCKGVDCLCVEIRERFAVLFKSATDGRE